MSTAATYSTQAFPVTIYANRNWQPTGVNISAPGQQFVTIQASGSWQNNPVSGMHDANGAPGYVCTDPHYPLVGALEGCLVGRTGGSAPFFVGVLGSANTSVTGEIQLVINDDLSGAVGAGLGDNSGQLSVVLTLVTLSPAG
jgi:hypothetical protein